jgi:hypothetical protein
MMTRCGSILALALLLGGCVNQNTWKPSVDPYADPNAANLSRDEADCRRIARESSGSTAGKTAKGTGIGAGVGAAAGAIFGAIAGSPGLGAAAGAAVGGLGGGGYEAIESSKDFKTVFSNCMRGRGHTVLN